MFRYLLLFLFLSSNAFAQFVSQEARGIARQSIMMEAPEPQKPEVIKLDDDIKIVMVINGEMISGKDINDRIKAFAFNLQIPINIETKDMLYSRVKQATIDEKIKLSEAVKEKIVISDKDVDEAIANIAENNGKSVEELAQGFRDGGVDFDVFKTQIRSDLSWIRLVRQKSRGEIEPTQKEIERFIANFEKDMSIEKVKISEIVVPKKGSREIESLMYNLRNDNRFALFAMQFSNSASSAKGGDLGWVDKEMLMPKIRKVLINMSEGDISEPIEIGDDYHIIKLERKYNPEQDKVSVPSKDEVKKILEGNAIEEFASNYLNKIRQKSIIEIKD